MKRFTVITVCLNIEDAIADTIASVLEQDCNDFEYLIKDGCSKDNTLKIAESYAPAFAERGISYRILSQPDTGIYDAMNQAAQAADGEWLLYMNAGDRFADRSVLSQVAESSVLESADVVYGDRIQQYDDLYRYEKALPIESIRFRIPFCHQSVFTRRELLVTTPYDLRYRISSDYHFYLRMYLSGKNFAHIPMAMAIFDVDGVSADLVALKRDVLNILEDMPVRDEEAIQKCQNDLNRVSEKEKKRRLVQKYMPKKLYRWIRHYRKRKEGWKSKDEFFSDAK